MACQFVNGRHLSPETILGTVVDYVLSYICIMYIKRALMVVMMVVLSYIDQESIMRVR